jgi:hypothetical protein
VTYGQWRAYHKGALVDEDEGVGVYPEAVRQASSYRQHTRWCATHLRTARVRLLRTLPASSLMHQGKEVEMCTDIIEMMHVLEASEKRNTNLTEPLMVYNRDASEKYVTSYYRTPNDVRRQQLLHRFAPGLLSQRTCEITVNSVFDHVYVLNLNRRTDRRERILRRCAKHAVSVQIFDAVDGFELPHCKDWEAYHSMPPTADNDAHPLEICYKRRLMKSPGAWGYVQTMKAIIRDATSRGFRRILTLDDDAIFARDFTVRFAMTMSTVPSDWRILYLGGSQHTEHSNTTETATELPWYRAHYTDGSFAVGLDSSLFAEVLNAPPNYCHDSCVLRDLYARHTAYVCYPNIVIADVTESDIQEGRNMQEHAKCMRWNLADYDIN